MIILDKRNATYTIVVPVEYNGREAGRVTAEFTQKELESRESMKMRLKRRTKPCMSLWIQIRRGSKSSLPSEALQIDGAYIENLIDGYRTLYVTGRELLGSEISEREIDLVDGSEYTGKRDTTRSITVGYQLLCTSPREFQGKFNKLSGILNKEQAKLIFADEPDKYFIGTKSSVGDVEPGRLNVKGEFTFYCCDPRKYSAAEKSFTAHQESGYQTLTIVNGGTESVPVSYDITHNHENGFIGIAM